MVSWPFRFRTTKADLAGFAFDRVFDMESQQKDIFDWGVKGIVEGQLAAASLISS